MVSGVFVWFFFFLKGVSGGGIMSLPTNQVPVLLGWLGRASQPDSEKHILRSLLQWKASFTCTGK